MKISQAKQMIKNISDKELHTPVMFVGSTGIGKSYLIKELAKDNNLEFIDLRPATQEVSDLIGIPKSREVTYKDILKLKTMWAEPEWWPKPETKGILALEEVNRAPEDVRQALFQLVTEWKLHTHVLPKGWVIVSLINPDNGFYHVNQLDPAFKRRFIQVEIEPDEIEWIIWGKKNKINEGILRFIEMFPKMLVVPEEISIEAKPTPAGYHTLSILLENQIIPKECIHEVASGIIGKEAATTFINTLHRNFEKPIKATEILKNYNSVRSKYKEFIKDRRHDLIYATMVDVIAECDNTNLKKEEVDNLHLYLIDSQPETITTILLKLNHSTLGKLAIYDDLVDYIKDIKKDVDSLN